jgi:hypothetical protein
MEGKGGSRPGEASSLCSLSAARSCSTRAPALPKNCCSTFEHSRAPSNESVRKEVIQPQVPLRLPCYDLVPVTELAFGAVPLAVGQNDFERSPLPWLDGRCVQGSGTYSPRHG